MKRAASENSDGGGLFPFLAVLLCTMGALLVLLVVLAQKAGQRVVLEQSESPAASGHLQNAVQANAEEVATLTRQLKEVRADQKQLRQLRKQADQRLRDEQLRLSHLEEHTRRLEHELARLSIAAQQLEATEKNQSVDQQQAQRELARLQKLIVETEKQLDQLREEASGKRSYAIVPYKGPNGTYRKPIYIECSKEGVTIYPEGIRFESSDFVTPGWPGNPLAAALRASREYLNAKAAKAGEPEPPDPYPLLLIRPDGVTQYRRALAAIASWDAAFGYEFIDGDWKLEFPELPDPQLAQVQRHAQLNARDHLARLVRAAPRRFRGIGHGRGSAEASGGTSGTPGDGGGHFGESHENGMLAQAAGGYSSEGNGGNGNGNVAGQSDTGTGKDVGAGEDSQYGALSDDVASNGQGEGVTDPMGTSQGGSATADRGTSDNQNSGSSAGSTGSNSLAKSNGQLAQRGSSVGANSSEGSSSSGGSSSAGGSGSSGGATSGGQASGSRSAVASANLSNEKKKSIADSHGQNWAVARGARGAVPIRRPISVLVRKDRLTLLPSRHIAAGATETGTVISLNQTDRQISSQFVEALRARIDQWGLAGNGLYWRPVLKLNLGPEAEQTAREITHLLHDSGVEISLQETATSASKTGARANATR